MQPPPSVKARPIVMIDSPFETHNEVLDATVHRYAFPVQSNALTALTGQMPHPVALLIAARDREGLPTVHAIRRLRRLGAAPVILVIGNPLRDVDVLADALRAGADAVLISEKDARAVLAEIVRWIAPPAASGEPRAIFADAPETLRSFLQYGVEWEYWDADVTALCQCCGVSRRRLARICAEAGGPSPLVTLRCARLLYAVYVRRGPFATPDRLAAVGGFPSTEQMIAVCQTRLGATIAALLGYTLEELRLTALQALYPLVDGGTVTRLNPSVSVERVGRRNRVQLR